VPSSGPVIGCCLVITLGFFVGAYGEIRFSWAGLIAGVLSSGMQSVYGVMVKQTLAVVNDDTWRLLMYNTVLSILVLFPICVLTGEVSQIVRLPAFYMPGPWVSVLGTGLLGFMINIAIFMQIKVTTALTSTISGTAKACAQTFLAVLLFGNPVSPTNLAGLCMSLGGSGAYSWVKYRENEAARRGGK
jgi:GDP-fucose transporter C1